MNQLYELSRQFPDEWVKKAPKGKFGNYIPHSVITPVSYTHLTLPTILRV